jgi:hypothetical protein
MKQKFYTKDDDNNYVTIPDNIAKEVIRQYIEARYTYVVGIALFIVGFLLGVIAS